MKLWWKHGPCSQCINMGIHLEVSSAFFLLIKSYWFNIPYSHVLDFLHRIYDSIVLYLFFRLFQLTNYHLKWFFSSHWYIVIVFFFWFFNRLVTFVTIMCSTMSSCILCLSIVGFDSSKESWCLSLLKTKVLELNLFIVMDVVSFSTFYLTEWRCVFVYQYVVGAIFYFMCTFDWSKEYQ